MGKSSAATVPYSTHLRKFKWRMVDDDRDNLIDEIAHSSCLPKSVLCWESKCIRG
ncbi:hypothetical protein PM082_010571 [Marasmius tenuissimus]|nr:hypothetical protein PM082_010571 [Marasmius tenuissimus]